MARIRTIKPEFFTSEDICSLEPLARLLYIALWCECDREGRMEWKPRTWKLRYFPADSCDIDALARVLVASGLVVLYGDGMAFVPTFHKHQHINPRESASILPPPDASARVSDASLPVTDAQVGREGKGREGKDILSSSADADDQQAGKATKLESRLAQITGEAIETFNASPLTKPEGTLSRVTLDSSVRRKQVKRCLDVARAICRRMYGSERITGEFWRDYWLAALADDFAAGRTQPGRGHENWRPDFEYLTRPDVMTKLFDRAVEDAA